MQEDLTSLSRQVDFTVYVETPAKAVSPPSYGSIYDAMEQVPEGVNVKIEPVLDLYRLRRALKALKDLESTTSLVSFYVVAWNAISDPSAITLTAIL